MGIGFVQLILLGLFILCGLSVVFFQFRCGMLMGQNERNNQDPKVLFCRRCAAGSAVVAIISLVAGIAMGGVIIGV